MKKFLLSGAASVDRRSRRVQQPSQLSPQRVAAAGAAAEQPAQRELRRGRTAGSNRGAGRGDAAVRRAPGAVAWQPSLSGAAEQRATRRYQRVTLRRIGRRRGGRILSEGGEREGDGAQTND